MSLLDAKMPLHSALLEDALFCSDEECEGGDGSGRERRCQIGELINVSFLSVLGLKCEPSLQSLIWCSLSALERSLACIGLPFYRR